MSSRSRNAAADIETAVNQYHQGLQAQFRSKAEEIKAELLRDMDAAASARKAKRKKKKARSAKVRKGKVRPHTTGARPETTTVVATSANGDGRHHGSSQLTEREIIARRRQQNHQMLSSLQQTSPATQHTPAPRFQDAGGRDGNARTSPKAAMPKLNAAMAKCMAAGLRMMQEAEDLRRTHSESVRPELRVELHGRQALERRFVYGIVERMMGIAQVYSGKFESGPVIHSGKEDADETQDPALARAKAESVATHHPLHQWLPSIFGFLEVEDMVACSRLCLFGHMSSRVWMPMALVQRKIGASLR